MLSVSSWMNLFFSPSAGGTSVRLVTKTATGVFCLQNTSHDPYIWSRQFLSTTWERAGNEEGFKGWDVCNNCDFAQMLWVEKECHSCTHAVSQRWHYAHKQRAACYQFPLVYRVKGPSTSIQNPLYQYLSTVLCVMSLPINSKDWGE